MRRNIESFSTFGFKARASLLYCRKTKTSNSCKTFKESLPLADKKQCVSITKCSRWQGNNGYLFRDTYGTKRA